MDKEAREKIKNYAAKWFDKGRDWRFPITRDMLAELEGEGEALLLELYKPPKDKPPLLSGLEISRIKFKEVNEPNWNMFGYARRVAQAQREADINFYS